MKRVIYKHRQINWHHGEALWWFAVMIDGKKEKRCRGTLRAAKELIDETEMPELRSGIRENTDGGTGKQDERG